MRDALDHDHAFLSPRQLGLDPVLYRGLIEVAEQLDSGSHHHVPSAEWQALAASVRRGEVDEAAANGDYFNMMHWS